MNRAKIQEVITSLKYNHAMHYRINGAYYAKQLEQALEDEIDYRQRDVTGGYICGDAVVCTNIFQMKNRGKQK